jgi:hypothetical protein
MTKSAIDFKKVGEQDFKKFANKYHLIAAWVAIILNPIWGIIDYVNSPNNLSILQFLDCQFLLLF